MKCEWCESEQIRQSAMDCYWITPDGKTSVEILDVPAIDCPNCSKYVTESIAQKIEEALFWNDISALGNTFRYEDLMNAPRKSKYFS